MLWNFSMHAACGMRSLLQSVISYLVLSWLYCLDSWLYHHSIIWQSYEFESVMIYDCWWLWLLYIICWLYWLGCCFVFLFLWFMVVAGHFAAAVRYLTCSWTVFAFQYGPRYWQSSDAKHMPVIAEQKKQKRALLLQLHFEIIFFKLAGCMSTVNKPWTENCWIWWRLLITKLGLVQVTLLHCATQCVEIPENETTTNHIFWQWFINNFDTHSVCVWNLSSLAAQTHST